MNDKLTKLFAGVFRKQGFQVVEWTQMDIIEFDNYYIKGMISFERERKRHKIRWETKGKYEILDIPINNGAVSAEFKKPFDLLNFLQRRLIWRKRS